MTDDDKPSDRDVLEATGRHPDEWFAFLDAQGANEWDHAGVREWLSSMLTGVDEVWPETIATNYRSARGLL
jgi:hypothetical protein